ncbi:MAG: hypothetical protein ACOYOK_01715 [Pseudobdellovibrionaceae bacterium]
MKARSSFLVLLVFLCSNALAAIPGNKRTIFTSGEKVYPIRYQLGQSTVVDLGVKPEVVICGNKNYFNIEKLKSGITIQPLSQYSTNLTILSGQKRFLFYLVPAGAQNPDGFVDVKWVSPMEQKSLRKPEQKADTQIEINEIARIGPDIEITIVRLKVSADKSRKIFDLLVKYKGSKPIQTNKLELIVFDGNVAARNQALAWEKDSMSPKLTVSGRLIIWNSKAKFLIMSARFKDQSLKIKLKGAI